MAVTKNNVNQNPKKERKRFDTLSAISSFGPSKGLFEQALRPSKFLLSKGLEFSKKLGGTGDAFKGAQEIASDPFKLTKRISRFGGFGLASLFAPSPKNILGGADQGLPEPIQDTTPFGPIRPEGSIDTVRSPSGFGLGDANIPISSGAGAAPAEPAPETAEEVARRQFTGEAEPSDLDRILGFQGGEPGDREPASFEDIKARLLQAREDRGFLSQEDIRFTEDNRRREIADIISRTGRDRINRAAQTGADLVQGQRALGINLSGGAANVASDQLREVAEAQNEAEASIQAAEQELIDALKINDIESAQRAEGRISILNTQINDLEDHALDQTELAEGLLQFKDEFALAIRGMDVDERESISSIFNLTRDDAQRGAELLFSQFGSEAFTDLSEPQIRALELRAGLPEGSFQRSIETLSEKKDLKFISGTKNQMPGVFDPTTGIFTPIVEAIRTSNNVANDSGFTQSAILNLKSGYISSDNKKEYLQRIGQDAREVVLADPTLSRLNSMEGEVPTIPVSNAIALFSMTADGSETREDLINIFRSEDIALDDESPDSLSANAYIDVAFGSIKEEGNFITNFFRGLRSEGEEQKDVTVPKLGKR